MNEDTRKFFEKLSGVADKNRDDDFEPKFVKASRDVELVEEEEQEVEVDIEKGKEKEEKDEEVFDEEEGSLAIDVYQTEGDIVIMAPVAGVSVDDLDIDITADSVTIKGRREKKEKIEKRDFLYQECYWGRFSRSIILPQEINPDHATANFKNGVLKIVLPKINKTKTKKMKIKFE